MAVTRQDSTLSCRYFGWPPGSMYLANLPAIPTLIRAHRTSHVICKTRLQLLLRPLSLSLPLNLTEISSQACSGLSSILSLLNSLKQA